MKNTNTKGYTLIELIMAIVLVGIIAIPIASMLVAQIQGTVASGDLLKCYNLGRYEIENLYSKNYSDIATANFTNYAGFPYDLTRTVTTVTGNNNAQLKNITVDVKKHGSVQVLVTFYTAIAINVTYQII